VPDFAACGLISEPRKLIESYFDLEKKLDITAHFTNAYISRDVKMVAPSM
jgi:hypothetical protein